MSAEDSKRQAAREAASLLPEAGVVGLGTGSTTRFFIDAVGELVKSGRKLVGVPTSQRSREQAQALGIPLLSDEGPWQVDVCVDGADEVSEKLDLIKGGGGAHAREKIVNRHARHNVIIVDESKLSAKLGEKWAVPVEVLPFGHLSTAKLLAYQGEPTLRLVSPPQGSSSSSGQPFVTDSGNFIYDLRTGPISAPVLLEQRLRELPGVVETGLFCARADLVIVAGSSGIRQLRRSA
jgi:ribose 5-phosphate isomerase A